MEFVRFLNRAETLSKLNGQDKVGKAALWRREEAGTGDGARQCCKEVYV